MIGLTNLPGSWEHFYNDFVTDGVKYMFRVSTVSLLKVVSIEPPPLNSI